MPQFELGPHLCHFQYVNVDGSFTSSDLSFPVCAVEIERSG